MDGIMLRAKRESIMFTVWQVMLQLAFEYPARRLLSKIFKCFLYHIKGYRTIRRVKSESRIKKIENLHAKSYEFLPKLEQLSLR